MREQLKFLLPDVQTANQASEALLLARIDDKNISFLAKPGTNLGKLHPASTLESTNMINGGERGLATGAAVGLIAGLISYFFFPSFSQSLHVNEWVLIGALMALGAALSAIGSAVFGVNLLNDDLAKYQKNIENGAILMIVSAPFQRSTEISKIVSKLHLKF
ncbi:MAG: hypothetical protein H7Z20_04605 [Bdellovibrio sp.]|nr:hypothetical protein [Methylotenera sp.]